MAHLRRNISLALTAAACLVVVGCGGSGAPDLSGANRQTAIALKLAGTMYGDYITTNRGAAPKDSGAMRKYIESRLSDLSVNGVKKADDILISPRDGQPFVFVTGQTLAPPDQPDTPWAVYESTGVDGKRMIANTRGVVVELSPEEFAAQAPGAH